MATWVVVEVGADIHARRLNNRGVRHHFHLLAHRPGMELLVDDRGIAGFEGNARLLDRRKGLDNYGERVVPERKIGNDVQAARICGDGAGEAGVIVADCNRGTLNGCAADVGHLAAHGCVDRLRLAVCACSSRRANSPTNQKY